MKIIENNVRGVEMKFVGYTRSLELCSKMNYETENLDFIDEIKPGEVLYDLGACEGRFAIYAALKGINCYAFEPEKNNHQAFQENIRANTISEKNLHVFKIAIGDEAKKATLKIGQPWAGGHQKVIEQQEVRSDLNFNFVEEETVDVESIDGVIARLKLPPPDFLKVDIDGSEMPFIKGAQQTLSSLGLKKIIFELEINDKNFNTIVGELNRHSFVEVSRHQVPNEKFLFNIIYEKK
jgi:FkbM family methyltransferase